MVRTYGEAELHRSVGELAGKMEMLLDQQRHVLAKIEDIGDRLGDVENKLDPMPGIVSSHDSRINKLEMFDGKIAAVVMLISITVGAVGTGLWALILNFPAVLSFLRRFFTGAP